MEPYNPPGSALPTLLLHLGIYGAEDPVVSSLPRHARTILGDFLRLSSPVVLVPQPNGAHYLRRADHT